MTDLSFTGLLIVAAAAFAAPLVVDLAPGPAIPAVVAEIVAGILIGPSVLGIVEVDEPIRVLSQIGVVFLFFLAGLEIAFDRARSSTVRLAFYGFAVSFAAALIVAHALEAGGLVDTPLFVAIVLAATAFGIVVAVLKDAGQTDSDLGQLIIVCTSIADFGAVILLSLFFSHQGSGIETTAVLLGLFGLVVAAVTIAIGRARMSGRLGAAVARLERTTAQIGVRGAFVLLVAFVALAEDFGLEIVLGAFLAGAVLSLVGRQDLLTTTRLGERLEAVGFGVFIPIFFVTSGIQFDGAALFGSASALVPRADPPPRAAAREGRAGAALPIAARRPLGRCAGAPPGHVASLHRRGGPDRGRAGQDHPGDGGGPRRGRPDVGPDLPRGRAGADLAEGARRRLRRARRRGSDAGVRAPHP